MSYLLFSYYILEEIIAYNYFILRADKETCNTSREGSKGKDTARWNSEVKQEVGTKRERNTLQVG